MRTPPIATFDESQPHATTVTLPLLVQGEGDEATWEAARKTLDHVGLLYFQRFLNGAVAGWPRNVDTLQLRRDNEEGGGVFQIHFNYRNVHDLLANQDFGQEFRDHLARLIGGDASRFGTMGDLVEKAFDHGNRKAKREDLPGMLAEVMDASHLSRIKAGDLEAVLPTVNAPSPPKPKF